MYHVVQLAIPWVHGDLRDNDPARPGSTRTADLPQPAILPQPAEPPSARSTSKHPPLQPEQEGPVPKQARSKPFPGELPVAPPPNGPPTSMFRLEPEQTIPPPAQRPPSPCAAAAQPDREIQQAPWWSTADRQSSMASTSTTLRPVKAHIEHVSLQRTLIGRNLSMSNFKNDLPRWQNFCWESRCFPHNTLRWKSIFNNLDRTSTHRLHVRHWLSRFSWQPFHQKLVFESFIQCDRFLQQLSTTAPTTSIFCHEYNTCENPTTNKDALVAQCSIVCFKASTMLQGMGIIASRIVLPCFDVQGESRERTYCPPTWLYAHACDTNTNQRCCLQERCLAHSSTWMRTLNHCLISHAEWGFRVQHYAEHARNPQQHALCGRALCWSPSSESRECDHQPQLSFGDFVPYKNL